MDHSIQTITPALVATIGRAEMDALLDRHPAIATVMHTSQLVDEGATRAWITSMGRRTSVERVAHLMCELYLRARDIGLSVEPLGLPLSQIMLADPLGMTPVHVNRVLKELRLGGAMTITRGNLVIRTRRNSSASPASTKIICIGGCATPREAQAASAPR